jgi:hypothetical protein
MLALLLWTAAASAATIGRDTTLDEYVYVAGAGERNDVSVRPDGGRFVVSDAAGLTAGTDCVAISPIAVSCLGRRAYLHVTLGDGDEDADHLDGGMEDAAANTVRGGAGDDDISAGPGADRVVGGPGHDSIYPIRGTGGAHIVVDDGVRDEVRCEGAVHVVADPQDVLYNCRDIERRGPAVLALGRVGTSEHSADRDRWHGYVHLLCPYDLDRGGAPARSRRWSTGIRPSASRRESA